MSIAPLFVADMPTLQSRLRLTGAASTDAVNMLSGVVEEVRIGFYLKLTQGLITTILGTAYVANPSTDAGYIRALANATEVLWCRLKLLRLFPVLFLETSSSKNQVWNDEAITRPASQKDLETEIKRLEAELNQNLDVLTGVVATGNDPTSRVFDGTPDVLPDLPGATIFPQLRGDPNTINFA